MYDKIIKLSFKEEYLMEINDILEKFNFKGELEECNVFGSGHINTTYLAKYIENGKEKKICCSKSKYKYLFKNTLLLKTRLSH